MYQIKIWLEKLRVMSERQLNQNLRKYSIKLLGSKGQ